MYEPFSLVIYLLNSLLSGMYIQKLLPCRYRRIPALILWVAAYFASQLFVGGLTSTHRPADVLFRIIIGFVVFFGMSLFICRGDRTVKLYAAVSFTAGSEIVRFISSAAYAMLSSWVLQNLFGETEYTTVSAAEKAAARLSIASDVCLAVAIFLQFAILGVYLYSITRQLLPFPHPLRVREKLFLLLPGITVLCIAVTLQLLVITVENGMSVIVYETIPGTRFWVPLICLLLLGIILSSVYLFQEMLQGHEEEKKRLLFENQIAQIQNEVAEIQDVYADMRSLRHDLRGHLANISALVKENAPNNDTLPEYIGKMEMTLDRLDFPSQTGDPITDVIIRRKCQEAEKRQIPLQIDFTFPVGQKIDAYDIGIVLNNGLTNALEACPSDTSGIVLRSYMKGNLFFIEVENAFDGEIIWNEKTGLPMSSKESGQLHGMGLSSVRRCAQKYNGDIDIDISHKQGKNTFQLTVMMCGKDFTPENQ